MENKSIQYQLLENKIKSIVRQVMMEKESKENNGDSVINQKEYKKQYKHIQQALSNEKIDATQVMSSALGFDPSDDSARSYAFKKLHQEDAPGGGKYMFSESEVGKIFNAIP